MDGVLVIDKPAGLTSFDVVKRVRTRLGQKKAGHTGTLDPMATGVLPICLGEATKIAGFITEGDKAYDAVLRLGVETDTLDAMGKELKRSPVPALSREQVELALAPFRGAFLQQPPMYSAVKIAGKRLYEHARAGEEVERAARPVVVHALTLTGFSGDEVSISVRSSKGFFVRVLAQEIGRALGCGAHLCSLRRTQSGPFSLAQATTLEALEQGGAPAVKLISCADALAELPAVPVDAAQAARVRHGVSLDVAPAARVRVLGPGGELIAVADAPLGRLKYLRVLAATA